MAITLSRALLRAAELALSNRNQQVGADAGLLLPIAGMPFFLATMESMRANQDFLVLGRINDPLTGEQFVIGHPARAAS